MAPSILVVDDEFAVRDSLAQWLRMDGYAVDVAENGSAALRQLTTTNYAVALVDLKMPGMDGVELQRRIHEAKPEVLVIRLKMSL